LPLSIMTMSKSGAIRGINIVALKVGKTHWTEPLGLTIPVNLSVDQLGCSGSDQPDEAHKDSNDP
jgi:hypothetical protein